MEMESSLFFHLCTQMGYRAGTICTVISGPTTSAAVIDYDKSDLISSKNSLNIRTLILQAIFDFLYF